MIEAALGRRWLGSSVVLLLAATLFPAAVSTLFIWRFFPDWWQLSVFFWYSIPGNSFILLPHEPAVLYAGTLYPAALVAAVGGLATTLASTVDHVFFTRAFRLKKLEPVKETRIVRLTVRLFNHQPWWTIVVFAFTPLPFYPIRLVAPMSGYPVMGYVSAVVFGRIPRYFLLALGGAWVKYLTQSYLSW